MNREVMSEVKARALPALVLAYVGDAVFELFVRTRLIDRGAGSVNRLHKESIGYVSAKAQAATIKSLLEYLTEEETAIFKRGRNANSTTVPKNATISDYRMATGFEALIGYLYLTRQHIRLQVLFDKMLQLKQSEE